MLSLMPTFHRRAVSMSLFLGFATSFSAMRFDGLLVTRMKMLSAGIQHRGGISFSGMSVNVVIGTNLSDLEPIAQSLRPYLS